MIPLGRKGFTILELMIVIAMIAVLLSVAIPSYLYYVGASRATRLNTYASAMMGGARLANGMHIAAGLSPSDLLAPNDNNAAFGWPTANYVCNVVAQQLNSGPDTVLSPTSTPISCNGGVLQDVTATNPSDCSATYVAATSSNTSAYVDTSKITAEHCK